MSHILDDDEGPKLYSERQDWADVTPIPQYEGVKPIAPIFYTPEYTDATDYFRGIVRTGEKSQRILELTEAIIRMNPAHYSAWQYRYQTLLAIKSPLDVELKLMDGIAIEFLKTYQVWHHRRLILTALHDSSSTSPPPTSAPTSARDAAKSELDFITRALLTDTKNYHTWSYRQWLLAFFDLEELWAGELAYVERLLQEDVRNNSAWHHRFFVVFGRVKRGGEVGELQDVLKRELAYTKDQIALAPNNPSAWNYLRGTLEYTNTPYSSLETFVQLYILEKAPELDVLDLENPPPGPGAQLPCVASLEFYADILEKRGEKENIEKAVTIWKSLANEHDTMRKKCVA